MLKHNLLFTKSFCTKPVPHLIWIRGLTDKYFWSLYNFQIVFLLPKQCQNSLQFFMQVLATLSYKTQWRKLITTAALLWNLVCGSVAVVAKGWAYVSALLGHNGPTIQAPGILKSGGMILTWKNWRFREKPVPVLLCQPQSPQTAPDANPGLHSQKPGINCLAHLYMWRM
jgi:hypothetical protein